MEIFLDSSREDEIRKWLPQGVVDGVTTNPTIMRKDGVQNVEECSRRICELLGDRPVSVEVTTNDHDEMIRQARIFVCWGSNIVVKIPIVNEDGESSLGVIHQLNEENIAVNATALLSFNQAMLAAKAGATYVSLFAGRIADEGNDPVVVIQNVRKWLEMWGYGAKIVVGSIRTVMDIQSAALAGAHIVTVPPQFFPKLVDHKYSRDTVRQFNRDAAEVLEQVEQPRAVIIRA
jgi:transaldolase